MFETTIRCDICGKPMKEEHTFPPVINYFELKYKTISPLALPFDRGTVKYIVCSECIGIIKNIIKENNK